MKAVPLPFYGKRLNALAKDLFLEHGWDLPEGFRDRACRDPRTFTLGDWQQAKRAEKDPRDVKRVFQEAWAVSDTGAAFAHALEEKGYFLARGDRRGFVALDVEGEVYAVARWTGQKTRDVRAKLGDGADLRSVADTKAHIAATMRPVMSAWQKQLAEKKRRLNARQETARHHLAAEQRAARAGQKTRMDARRTAEARARQARFRRGLSGLWDRLRGDQKRIRRENEQEAWAALKRDREETDALILQHLAARRALKQDQARDRARLNDQRRDLIRDRKQFNEMRRASTQRSRDGPGLVGDP